MDAKISQLLEMQKALAREKGWEEDRTPEHAPLSILWSIDELGEAIAIIKKKGADGIMNNESVRAHYVEEVADTFMYLLDMMSAYNITAEEFSDAYIKKFEKNMGRSWSENSIMYEKSSLRLIIFDMEGTIVHGRTAYESVGRTLEELSRTDVKLALVSDFDTQKVREILSENGLDSDSFNSVVMTSDYSEAYTRLMSEFDVKPEECAVCAASTVAIKLAERCGAVPCAVKGRFARSVYEKAGAKYVFDSIDEIKNII